MNCATAALNVETHVSSGRPSVHSAMLAARPRCRSLEDGGPRISGAASFSYSVVAGKGESKETFFFGAFCPLAPSGSVWLAFSVASAPLGMPRATSTPSLSGTTTAGLSVRPVLASTR